MCSTNSAYGGGGPANTKTAATCICDVASSMGRNEASSGDRRSEDSTDTQALTYPPDRADTLAPQRAPKRGVRVPFRLIVLSIFIAALTASTAGAKTLKVCHSGCTYKTIQDAVDASKKKDTITVKPGTYREGVIVKGHKHDKLTLTGNPLQPDQVKLIGNGLHGAPAQNAIAVSGADKVTLEGFFARGFKANGFYVENANGYTMDSLIAKRDGEYGLFAFNSIGGSMSNSTASEFNDSGFYVGQTPVQKHPKRTT